MPKGFDWTGVRTDGSFCWLTARQYERLMDLYHELKHTCFPIGDKLWVQPVAGMTTADVEAWLDDFTGLRRCEFCGFWQDKKLSPCRHCDKPKEAPMPFSPDTQIADVKEAVCCTAQGRKQSGEPEACVSQPMTTQGSTGGRPPTGGGGSALCDGAYGGGFDCCATCYNPSCKFSKARTRTPYCYQPSKAFDWPSVEWSNLTVDKGKNGIIFPHNLN